MCIGVAYRGGTNDTRASLGTKILTALVRSGAEVSYHDPLVPEMTVSGDILDSLPLTTEILGRQDLVVDLIPQLEVDWQLMRESAPFVFDCANALGVKRDGRVRLWMRAPSVRSQLGNRPAGSSVEPRA